MQQPKKNSGIKKTTTMSKATKTRDSLNIVGDQKINAGI